MKKLVNYSLIAVGGFVVLFAAVQVLAVIAWRGGLDGGFWKVFCGLIALFSISVIWVKTGHSPFVLAARACESLQRLCLAAEAGRIQSARSLAVAWKHFIANYPDTVAQVMSREGVQ